MQVTHVRRVFAKVPGAKRGVAAYDFLLGAWLAPCRQTFRFTSEFAEIVARYPAGTQFKLLEVRVR